jgi:glycosyltransferase involved in cell wall biosynthesis
LGSKILASRPFDLVFFSTTQWPVLLAGLSWRKKFRVPFVVDLQDPWYTNYYSRPDAPPPPGGFKYKISNFLARHLEKKCFSQASGFISVSENYLNDLSSRYPWFSAKPKVVIPFGADESELQLARASSVMPCFLHRDARLHLVYVGAAGPIMQKALNLLFRALACFKHDYPDEFKRLQFSFFGTSYAPDGIAITLAKLTAEQNGVGDAVEEDPARVGYFAALRTLGDADVVLLLGSDDRAYSPSKIANLVLAGKPLLGLVSEDSQAQEALLSCGAAFVFLTGKENEESRLAGWFHSLVCGKNVIKVPNNEFVLRYQARSLTMKQAAFFEAIVR